MIKFTVETKEIIKFLTLMIKYIMSSCYRVNSVCARIDVFCKSLCSQIFGKNKIFKKLYWTSLLKWTALEFTSVSRVYNHKLIKKTCGKVVLNNVEFSFILKFSNIIIKLFSKWKLKQWKRNKKIQLLVFEVRKTRKRHMQSPRKIAS